MCGPDALRHEFNLRSLMICTRSNLFSNMRPINSSVVMMKLSLHTWESGGGIMMWEWYRWKVGCTGPLLRACSFIYDNHVATEWLGTGVSLLSGAEKGSSWAKFTCHFQCVSEIALTPAYPCRQWGEKIRGNRRRECAVTIQISDSRASGGQW